MWLPSVVILALLTPYQADPQPAESPSKALRIGDEVPRLQLAAWVTPRPPVLPGEPPAGAQRPVLVVHFWSVDDPPSTRQAPHLAQLARRHPPADLVVIAITNDDPSIAAPAVDALGLNYAVGCDSDNQTTETWLEAVDEFPWTFVIDRGGRVLWAGNSMWELATVTAAAVAGRFDLDAARARAGSEDKAAALRAELRAAARASEISRALRIADRIIGIDPRRPANYVVKRTLLRQAQRAADLAAVDEAARQALWDDPAGLHEMLEWHWDEPDLAARNPALMLAIARRLVELTHRADPFAWLELARVQKEIGDLPAAVESQSRAVELLVLDPGNEAGRMLAYLRALDALRGKAATQPAPPTATRPSDPEAPHSPGGLSKSRRSTGA